MAVLHAVEADWHRYFFDIRNHCPWSWAAWQKHRILICEYKSLQQLGQYQAIVYVCDLNARRLKKLADHLNQKDPVCEWLWSHPQGGGVNSTPRPCLIQQDRQFLYKLRSQLNKISN